MIGKWFKGKDKGPDKGKDPGDHLPDKLGYEEARDLVRHEDVNVRLALAQRGGLQPAVPH